MNLFTTMKGNSLFMKSFYNLIFYYIILFGLYGFSISCFAQDSIGINHIMPYSYTFQLDKGRISGPGKDILYSALSEAQYVILGDHYRSKREYEFASTLIEHLHGLQFKNLVLEIGPLSSLILNQQLNSGDHAAETLRKLNQKYSITSQEHQYNAIPHFKSVESTELIHFAATSNWMINSIGLDAWSAYHMIFDFLFQKLPTDQQNKIEPYYKRAQEELESFYKKVEVQNNDQVLQLIENIKNSKDINNFVNQLRSYRGYEELIEALDQSIDYWWKYGHRDFYTKNKFNAQNNKDQMRKIVECTKVDLEKDKMFIYGWQNHLTNGFTSNGFTGIGNTMNELANYYGNRSLNIAMIQRFYKKENTTLDRSKSDDHYARRFSPFNQLGSKDSWTLIDLRPFNKEFFWGNYILPPEMEKIFRRYDLLIISKTDEEATPNY